MRKLLPIVVVIVLATVGCVIGEALAPEATSTPMAAVDYIAKMRLLGDTVVQVLHSATSVVAYLDVNDPEFQAGLEREALRMAEVHDTAARMVPPAEYAEPHALFVEATGLYRDGLWAAASVAETGDIDGLEEVGRLMWAADEKLRQAGHKVRQRSSQPKAY